MKLIKYFDIPSLEIIISLYIRYLIFLNINHNLDFKTPLNGSFLFDEYEQDADYCKTNYLI